MHQRDDGRIVLGEPDGAPDNEAHTIRLESRPDDFPFDLIAIPHGERSRAIPAGNFRGRDRVGLHRLVPDWQTLLIYGWIRCESRSMEFPGIDGSRPEEIVRFGRNRIDL